MAKEIIHVGVAVIGDYPVPNEGNLLGLGASVGENETFLQIFAPTRPLNPGKFWKKHPTEWETFSKGTTSLEEGFTSFQKWLESLGGNTIAISGGLDFWWIYSTFMKLKGKCPFGFQPLEVDSIIYSRGRSYGTPQKVGKDVCCPKERAILRYLAFKGKDWKGRLKVAAPSKKAVEEELNPFDEVPTPPPPTPLNIRAPRIQPRLWGDLQPLQDAAATQATQQGMVNTPDGRNIRLNFPPNPFQWEYPLPTANPRQRG